MSDKLLDLTSLIKFASVNADKIFRKTGVIHPMYHAITASGQTEIISPDLSDKDTAVALMKALFVLHDIDRYVFIDEAWILDTTKGGPEIDIEKVQRHGIRNHPDRREIVMFSAEDRRGGRRTAKQFILRPEIGKPRLSPLEFDPLFDHSEGRMVGLLNVEKPK